MSTFETQKQAFLHKYLKPTVDVTDFNGRDETLVKALQYLVNIKDKLNDVIIVTDMKWNWDAYIKILDHQPILNYVNDSKRFIVVILYLDFLNLTTETINRHCNAIIFDSKEMTMERFDPVGQTQDKYDPSTLDIILQNKFPEYKLKDLSILDNEQGVQTLQCLEPVYRRHHLTDPPGFCVAWVIWYIEARFSCKIEDDGCTTEAERLNLWTDILKSITYDAKEKQITIRGFIRNYSHYIMSN